MVIIIPTIFHEFEAPMNKKTSYKPKKEAVTHKLLKPTYQGESELIDPVTGEYVPAQDMTLKDGDFNFHKVWLGNFINSLDDLTNQKIKVAFYIINNLDSENRFISSQREIAQNLGISPNTVNRAINTLQYSDPPFLLLERYGVYRINPDIIYKGQKGKRLAIVVECQSAFEERQATRKEKLRKAELAKKRAEEAIREAEIAEQEALEAEEEFRQMQEEEESQIPGQTTVIDDYPETVPMAAASKNKKEPLDMK